MIRNETQIQNLTEVVEANAFGKMMTLGQNLSKGTSEINQGLTAAQCCIINGLNSQASLEIKNQLADLACKLGFDFAQRDTLGVQGLFEPGL